MIIKYVLPVVAFGLLAFAVMQVLATQKKVETPQLIMQPPRAQFANRLAGSGIIEAKNENISIGSPTPGIVTEIVVKVGQHVHVGDPLFRLDDRAQLAELKVRKSAVAAAAAELERLRNQPRPEQLTVNRASIHEMEAALADMNDQLKRAKDLFAKRVVQDEQVFRAQQAQQMAEWRLNKNKAELALLEAGAWIQDLNVAQASVDRANSQVEQAQTEIERLTVRALVDAQVLQVNVRPGEYVGAPSERALIVLGNVDQFHVRVDIDEHDIPRFIPGTNAKASIKGRSQDTFGLSFVRVEPYVIPKKSLTGMNTERVDTRVLQVIFAVNPTDKKIFVGQQVDVYINTEVESGEEKSKP